MSNDKIEKLGEQLYDTLTKSGVAGITGVGVGDNAIIVYVLNAHVAKHIPFEFQGIDVLVNITGNIVAQDKVVQ